MTNLIGSHVSGGKDLTKAIAASDEFGCEVIQVFLSSPQAFKFTEADPELDEKFVQMSEERNLRVFVHGPYVMNFGSPKESSRNFAATLLKKNVARAKNVRAEGVVLHSGSSSTEPFEEGLKRVKESLLPLLGGLSDDSPMVLLEPMAGQGNTLASTVDSIPMYMEAVDWHPKLGVCLDTAHLLASGENIDQPGGMTELLERFESLVEMDRLKLIHANDSKVAKGSKKDRHENLGLGTLGIDCWKEIFSNEKVDVPLVLETPGELVMVDLAVLRKLRSESS